jgi:hypothetical protein
VPSAYPEPLRKNCVADRSIMRVMPSLRFTVSMPEIHSLFIARGLVLFVLSEASINTTFREAGRHRKYSGMSLQP